MKAIVLSAFSVILSATLACGSGAVVTITPEPTFQRRTIPPTAQAGEFGRFEGKDPDIKFNYTAKGVDIVFLSVKWEGTGSKGSCLFSPSGPAEVDEHGNFLAQNAGGHIRGTITGSVASGEWSIQQCGKGSWSAEFQGP